MSTKAQQTRSLAQLIKCLTEPSSYKLAKGYIAAADGGNEEAEKMLSDAILHVIQSRTIQVTAKMHGLRLFKDIFEMGNMDLVEALDERIEQHIVTVASYKKDKKVAERGQNYFVEVQKREMNPQTKLLGMSYVILALEIIQNFGDWYEINEENEQSRFKTYKKMLAGRGVTFPQTMSYIKPADRARFETNYSAWRRREQGTYAKDERQSYEGRVGSQMKSSSPAPHGRQNPHSYIQANLPLVSNIPSSPVNARQENTVFRAQPTSMRPKQQPQTTRIQSRVEQNSMENIKSRESEEPAYEPKKPLHSEASNLQYNVQLSNLRKQNIELRNRQEQHLAEIRQLKNLLEKKEQSNKSEVKSLKQENSNITTQLKEATDRCEQLNKQSKFNEQSSRVMERLKVSHAQLIEQKQSRIQALEDELSESLEELRQQRQRYCKLEEQHRGIKSKLENDPVETIKERLTKKLNEESTRANILVEDLTHSREVETELTRQIQKLRRQVSTLKRQQSLSNLSSEREPVLQNKVLKEKCRLLELKLKENGHVTPSVQRSSVMTRTDQHASNEDLSSNRVSAQLQLHRTSNNFFRSRGRMSSHSRRGRMNNTAMHGDTQPIGETEPYTAAKQKDEVEETLIYDELWFKPLNLKMYLFRNALLGKKKPFFDSEEVEVKLTHRNRCEFSLTFRNKTRRDIKLSCKLNDDENYVFSDQQFRQRISLAGGKWVDNVFSVLPSNVTHRYSQGTLTVNGRECVLFLPITILSYCEMSHSAHQQASEHWKSTTTQTFVVDYHILSPREYFLNFCTSESRKGAVMGCWLTFRIDPSMRVLLKMEIDKETNKCRITATYEPKSEGMAVHLLQVFLYCWKLPPPMI